MRRLCLRATRRTKDGKEHRYWRVVENRRVRGGRTVQKTLWYLGELNDSQQAGWCRTIAATAAQQATQLAFFPSNRTPPPDGPAVQVQMAKLVLQQPRQWGACRLAMERWERLRLDAFWAPRPPPSREGTSWLPVLKTLVAYRRIDPGSEWRLHRVGGERSAMADLLDTDFRVAAQDTLSRCLDKVLAHKADLFSHLKAQWADVFGATFEGLLYDLTSTYVECDPPGGEDALRRHGYSRDKRPDGVQVVIALMVTPEGLPLAYAVMKGNTAEPTTLPGFLRTIEQPYGQAQRIWIMDRGIPTDAVLATRRTSTPPVQYLVTELAALCHERWEIETALDELKTHLRGARIVLRSKTPDLVLQEFYGLLPAHFAVRGLMHEAALKGAVDPDRLSFLHAVRVVRRKLAPFASFPPSGPARLS